MKTDIYGILGMIKDGNIPKKILFKGKCYRYVNKEKDYYLDGYSYDEALFDEYVITDILDDEVEILETTITYKPDKIEKIDMFDYFTGYWYKELPEDFKRHLETNFETLNSKINEIIEVLNER